MSTTWIDTPGSALASRTDAIDFTVSAIPAFISVRFGDQRVEEIAYRDGEFFYPYLGSTLSEANAVALRRSGGWPRDATVHVQDGGGAAAYTPVDPTAWGQWTLDPLASNPGLNRNHPERVNTMLGFATFGGAPDLVPGKTAWTRSVDQNRSGLGGTPETYGAGIAPNIAAGPYTLLGRFYLSFFPIAQTLFGLVAGYPNARIAMGVHPTSRVIFTQGYPTGVSSSSLAWPADRLWHYASCRFDGVSTMRFGVDGAFVSLTDPGKIGTQAGAGCVLTIGDQPGGYRFNSGGGANGLIPEPPDSSIYFYGSAADIGAWGRMMSDAEVRELGSIALGKQL